MTYRRSPLLKAALGLLIFCIGQVCHAQLSERFGPYELHYSVVNTTFLDPAVASQYGLARGSRRAIVNLSLREHMPDGSTVARTMAVDGSSWDLTERRDVFDFAEIREGPAIYYIGQFKFLNREYRYFEFNFTPEGSTESYYYKFQHQMYVND